MLLPRLSSIESLDACSGARQAKHVFESDMPLCLQHIRGNNIVSCQ